MTILGPSLVISGLSRGHLLPCWPSRGHLGSILRHFSVMTSEDRRCIADFSKFNTLRVAADLLCFLSLMSFVIGTFIKVLAAFPGTAWRHLRLFGGHLGAILGPSWRPVGPIWGHLAPTSAIMDYRGSSCGLLRPSWGHLGAILRPSWGHLGPSWGHLGPSWDHLEAILGTSWGHLGPFHSYENH